MVNHTAKFRQKATYSCNTGYNLVGDSNNEHSEISSGTNLDQNDDASRLLDDRLPYVGISMYFSCLLRHTT